MAPCPHGELALTQLSGTELVSGCRVPPIKRKHNTNQFDGGNSTAGWWCSQTA